VSTADAIVKLRKKLGYTQQRLADLLGVTVVTISRYENGREPKSKALKRLADLAEWAQAKHLQDIFAAKLKGHVAAKLENLPSEGAERRIPKFWFELWMARQEEIFRATTGLIRKGADLSAKDRRMVLEGIRGLAEQTWKDLRTFGAEPVQDLDPSEDFSQKPLISTRAPTAEPGERDWMDCLYGPSPARFRGVLGRRLARPNA